MKKHLFFVTAITLAACTKQMESPSISMDASNSNKSTSKTSATGKTYYISPRGSDSNDGLSELTPWATVEKVNSTTFSAGDRILFKCSNYWYGNLHPRGSGVSGSPIVIDKYGDGSNPIIKGPGTESSEGFFLYNQDYWEVNNLDITNSHPGGAVRLRGIYVVNDNATTSMKHIYIQNCHVHNVDSYSYSQNSTQFYKYTGGIIFNGYFNDVLIKNNHVDYCTVEGIRTTNQFAGTKLKSIGVKILSNKIDHIYGDGIVLAEVEGGRADGNVVDNACMTNDLNFAGIWTFHSHNSVISHNEVLNMTGGKGDGEAFDADENSDGDIFEHNYTHDNANGFMEFMPTATNIIVRYNVSVNDCKAGIRVLNYLPSTNVNTIYNNVWYVGNNLKYVIDGYLATGFNGTLRNNILYCTGTVTSFSKGPVGSSSIFTNNCLYPYTITATNGPNGTVTGNIYSNPQFVNPGTSNPGMTSATAYQLKSTSPCRYGGIWVSGNGGDDYNHTPLPSGAPDIGAFQYIAQ